VDRELVFIRAGFGADALAYTEALELQRELHARRASRQIPDACLLLEHQPVYTVGRRTSPEDRPIGDPGAPVIDVDRGGKITWHGPGQLVGYPIVALDEPIDVISYVRAIEEALIRACADAGLATTRVAGRSGVWIPGSASGPDSVSGSDAPSRDGEGDLGQALGGTPRSPNGRLSWSNGVLGSPRGLGQDRKVGAIGIRVARGVTMHGFALNCSNDLSWFDRIVPCGISDASVADMVGPVESHLADALGATRTTYAHDPG
jgi:lipoyl(octanoyl) transferase